MKNTTLVDAVVYKNNEIIKDKEEIVSDNTTSLSINNEINRNFSTIADSLEEFAIGYMLGEGIINKIDDIKKIKIEKTKIGVELKGKKIENDDLVLVSDSSGGWRSKIKSINKVNSELKVKKQELLNNMEKLRKNALVWQKTGGTHVAAIVNQDNFIVKEDVSRHVAVDKVIGAGTINKFDFKNSYIIYSGRMPADMIIKIARIGIPLLASNAAPSLSGYKLANETNVTLVGFIRKDRFNVYSSPKRIIFDE